MITVKSYQSSQSYTVDQYNVAVPAQLFDIFSEDVSHPNIVNFSYPKRILSVNNGI
jgi:hypothetical protein